MSDPILSQDQCNKIFDLLKKNKQISLDLKVHVPEKYLFYNGHPIKSLKDKNKNTLLHLLCKTTKNDMDQELFRLFLDNGFDVIQFIPL
jgi:hypothetical protein